MDEKGPGRCTFFVSKNIIGFTGDMQVAKKWQVSSDQFTVTAFSASQTRKIPAACCAAGARGGSADSVQKQPQTTWTGDAQL